jgi:hypothetical protein
MVELNAGRLRVHGRKNGTPSVTKFALCGVSIEQEFALANAGQRHKIDSGLVRTPQHSAHRPLYRISAQSVQGFLEVIPAGPDVTAYP